jgi:uncharacterized protein YuzE
LVNDQFLDAESDVLYVKVRGARIRTSRSIGGDDFVILNSDSKGRVVGLQLVAFSQMSSARWSSNFHTGEIPEAIYVEVYRWLLERGQ